VAKDMGKNQQMKQNVQAENLQTQNPNFQSSMSSNSDSMSANDNFRPVQGDPDAPSGTRFSTTDPHGRPVQGDPDAPSGTRFSTTDPHGRPVQGDPDAPSGTRFSTSDPHGRPVQGDPNAPAGPRANIDSMDAMESMGMDEAASAAQGSQKMGNDANARGKGGGGVSGVFDSPSEVTQVGTAGADVWEVLKGGLQNRYTPEEYRRLLDDAWKRFGATLARTPYDAMKGISNVFFCKRLCTRRFGVERCSR